MLNRKLIPNLLIVMVVAGFAVLVVAPLWTKHSWCPPKRPATGSIQGYGNPTWNDNRPHYREWDLIKIQQKQTEPQQRQTAQGNEQWPPEWLCEETKLTDVLIAFFTYCLVAVGWFTLNRSEKSTRDVERAYLGGGGVCQIDNGQVRRNKSGHRLFRVEIGNHGKTPAFLKAFDIHFDTLAEVQKGPAQVTPRCMHVDQFPAGEKYRPVGNLLPIPREKYDIVYGAFWYEDIWGTSHCYRFIHEIAADGQTYSNVTGVDPSYSAWDWKDEKKKKSA